MTVIVWDGTTMVADRLARAGDHIRTCTKIAKWNGHLMAGAGNLSLCLEMMDWFRHGADPKRFPDRQKTDDCVDFWVVCPDRSLLKWDEGPEPMRFDDMTFTDGSGCAYAAGAMAMGATAVQAVLITCDLTAGCGKGYDSLTLDGPDEPVSVRL
jgi:hypothetical protein